MTSSLSSSSPLSSDNGAENVLQARESILLLKIVARESILLLKIVIRREDDVDGRASVTKDEDGIINNRHRTEAQK